MIIGRLSLQSGCGYVLPCMLKWIPDISNDPSVLPYKEQDVVGIAFFQTRCSFPRTDIIVWLPSRSDVTRIPACSSFLRNRYCDTSVYFDLNKAME